ncbi:MAG TPA: hypothetical protein VFA75_17965 [Nevskia sp.]|nr:hypothetical protein [Nevskia sp.]
MPIAALLQLLPVLINAIGPLLQKLDGAHASGDLALAQSVAGELADAFDLAQQAGALVATCQAQKRNPTVDEWAVFDKAWKAAQDELQSDLAAH